MITGMSYRSVWNAVLLFLNPLSLEARQGTILYDITRTYEYSLPDKSSLSEKMKDLLFPSSSRKGPPAILSGTTWMAGFA